MNDDEYQKPGATVGDGACIECNVNLVSPVVVEAGAFVAAGSTVTRDVPEDALAVARGRQKNIDGWVTRRERRLARSVDSSESPEGTDPQGDVSVTEQSGSPGGSDQGSDASQKQKRQKKSARKTPRE